MAKRTWCIVMSPRGDFNILYCSEPFSLITFLQLSKMYFHVAKLVGGSLLEIGFLCLSLAVMELCRLGWPLPLSARIKGMHHYCPARLVVLSCTNRRKSYRVLEVKCFLLNYYILIFKKFIFSFNI